MFFDDKCDYDWQKTPWLEGTRGDKRLNGVHVLRSLEKFFVQRITFSPIAINDRTRESSHSVSLDAVSSLTFAMQQQYNEVVTIDPRMPVAHRLDSTCIPSYTLSGDEHT